MMEFVYPEQNPGATDDLPYLVVRMRECLSTNLGALRTLKTTARRRT
jgi:hypothetical protein